MTASGRDSGTFYVAARAYAVRSTISPLLADPHRVRSGVSTALGVGQRDPGGLHPPSGYPGPGIALYHRVRRAGD